MILNIFFELSFLGKVTVIAGIINFIIAGYSGIYYNEEPVYIFIGIELFVIGIVLGVNILFLAICFFVSFLGGMFIGVLEDKLF